MMRNYFCTADRDVSRIQSNIYDGAFFAKIINELAVNYLKAPSYIFDWVLNTPLAVSLVL